MRLIFIHGPAASGKLTVAKELSSLTGLPLFHNHVAVDIALAFFEFGSEPFVRLRERIWLDVFDEAARSGRSFIFTFNPEATVDPRFIERASKLIEAASGRVDFVELECAEEEIERRLGNEGRADFGKLRSVEDLRRLKAAGAFDFPPLPEPRLRVRTDELTPEAAARFIAENLEE
jgi:chloramphenicol 3-O-phosphotransferase